MDLHLIGMFAAEFLSGAARLASGALLAGVWQGLLLCVATGVVLKAVPKSTAKLRFVVWSSVFCVSAALPFVDFAATASSGRGSVAAGPHWVFDTRWSYLLAAVWLLAAAYRLGEILLQGLGLRALWRSAVPVPDEALAGLDMPLTVAGRSVELCTSSEVDRPSVIGFFAPRILIPDWLFARLTATELNHIVLHEMEHLRRRDDWVNLLQKVGLVLLPLNPALFWIDRRLSTERELACDDGVLERVKTPRAYAASLTSVAERRLEARRSSRMGALALAATGLLGRRSELGQRIESILGRRAPVSPAFAGGVAALLVAAVVGSAAWLAHAPQLISFGTVAGPGSLAVASGQISASGVVGRGDLLAGARVQEAGFRVSGVEARAVRAKSVPQRLKPRGGSVVYGTAEAVPLSKANGSAYGQMVRVSKTTAFDPMVAVSEVKLFAEGEAGPAVRPAVKANPMSGAQWIVLTSWEDAPASSQVSRVVIATPDGRFLVAPYAAVPTQAGWLIVQL